MSESEIVPIATTGEIASSIVPDDMVVFGQTYARPQDNPARMYLLDLAEGSRPAMAAAINTVANALLPGATLDDIAWHKLTLQHTAAVRSWLMTEKQVLGQEDRGIQALQTRALQQDPDRPAPHARQSLRSGADGH